MGCGNGELAHDLVSRGYDVIAIDLDPEAVAVARERGVDAVAVDFLDLEDEPRAQAILFTRSLHHIAPLDAALDRAERLLEPGGRLLFDEFAVERMDGASAAWFYGLQHVLKAAGLSLDGHETGEEPLERWRLAHRHEPPLTTGREMLRGIRERYEVELDEVSRYLYRYFQTWIDDAFPSRDELVERISDAEEMLIRAEVLQPLGLQAVARPAR